VNWLQVGGNFVAVDRAVFVEVRADGSVLPAVSGAIAETMPPVCTNVDDRLEGSTLPLCAERKD